MKEEEKLRRDLARYAAFLSLTSDLRAVAALGELIKQTLDRLDGSVPPRPDGNGTSGGGVSTSWTAQLTTGTGRRHIRRLADAAWQPELKEALRRVANDYDEVVEDIETDADKIRHRELLYR